MELGCRREFIRWVLGGCEAGVQQQGILAKDALVQVAAVGVSPKGKAVVAQHGSACGSRGRCMGQRACLPPPACLQGKCSFEGEGHEGPGRPDQKNAP